MRRRAFAHLISICALTACTQPPRDINLYYAARALSPPTIETQGQTASYNLMHCRGHGCRFTSSVSLSQAEWRSITSPLRPRPQNAAAERDALKSVIKRFESTIGPKTGTQGDKGGTSVQAGPFQLDCVDESTNTTSYLHLLEKNNLLRFHTLATPAIRWPLIHSGKWPHQAAVIEEKSKNIHTPPIRFAVDSWFHDNGAPAEIVPLAQWKDGWRPQKGT